MATLRVEGDGLEDARVGGVESRCEDLVAEETAEHGLSVVAG